MAMVLSRMVIELREVGDRLRSFLATVQRVLNTKSFLFADSADHSLAVVAQKPLTEPRPQGSGCADIYDALFRKRS